MNIGFWNINSSSSKIYKDLSDYLVTFCLDKELDILCVAEMPDPICINFLKKINAFTKYSKFSHVKNSKDRLKIFTRLANKSFIDLSMLYTTDKWASHKVTIPTKLTFNLITVHFNSKINWSESSLAMECVNLSRDIQIIEKKTQCSETVLIGDFNMSPFEIGLNSANGINAVSDLNYAYGTPKGRMVNGSYYPFFYNPMWNFYGDFSNPLGTHYFRSPGHVSHEWHIYDQVIFRPSLKKYLNKDFVEIVDRIGADKLTAAFNRPDRINYSDHLPIIFKLTL